MSVFSDIVSLLMEQLSVNCDCCPSYSGPKAVLFYSNTRTMPFCNLISMYVCERDGCQEKKLLIPQFTEWIVPLNFFLPRWVENSILFTRLSVWQTVTGYLSSYLPVHHINTICSARKWPMGSPNTWYAYILWKLVYLKYVHAWWFSSSDLFSKLSYYDYY